MSKKVTHMESIKLFDDLQENREERIALSSGLFIEVFGGQGKKPSKAVLYRKGVLVKNVDLKDRVAKRLFIVDTVDLGASKSYLAAALGISRQTIDNHLAIRTQFGKEGLIQGYRADESKDRRKQRQLNKEELSNGNKAQIVAALRAKEREELLAQQESLPLSLAGSNGNLADLANEDLPFAEEHDWEKTRYAGVFLYLITLTTQCDWLRLVLGYFGNAYRILMVFILMAATNTRSIEQLKNIRSREGGVVLGIKRIASKPTIWEWFYHAANMKATGPLLTHYFRHQIQGGLVGLAIWFTDGHLLPYSGKHRVHYAYNTQRRMPVPGRTAMVTCDGSGRIVDFEIQEGKGDMRTHIATLGNKWHDDIPQHPVQVFDREGHGFDFFSRLIESKTPFVTWEKHIDTQKLAVIDDSEFTLKFELNGKEYAVFEGEKTMVADKPASESGQEQQQRITLRRIYLWNRSSNRKTCGLAWTGEVNMTTEECARAILCRWGASENTFKHLKDRHPLHYHPGFGVVKSDRQDIANPEIKAKATLIEAIRTELSKLFRKLSKAKEALNSSGVPRQNSTREKLQSTITENELALSKLIEEKKELEPRVDVSTLEDYTSFKRIDNEGKYLFDFVTISIWNARKQMIEWLSPHFNDKNELVDLFYAITNCHGWIKSSKTAVTVRLEALQQPRHRLAQEQLCRRLTSLMTRTPSGKRFLVEVGEAPV
jgi:hypothetical protein